MSTQEKIPSLLGIALLVMLCIACGLTFADGLVKTSGGGGSGVSDHGALTGLGDDDHTQYAHRTTVVRTDGSRAMTAALISNLEPTAGVGQQFNKSGGSSWGWYFSGAISAWKNITEGLNVLTFDASSNSLFAGKVVCGIGPTDSLDAATKGYVDNNFVNRTGVNGKNDRQDAALDNETGIRAAADAAIKVLTTHISANDNIIDSSWQSAESAAGNTSAFNVLNATRYWSGISGAEQRNTWHAWIGHSNLICRTAAAPWETSIPRQTFDVLRTNTFLNASSTWFYYHPYMADATRWNGNYTTIVKYTGTAGKPTHREVNLAYNGATLSNYTSTTRIDDTFHNVSSLDALTVMLGINDTYSVTTAQRASMLKTIINKLKTKFSNPSLEVNIINEPGRVANTGGAYSPALYLAEGNVYAAALLNTGLVDFRRAYDLWDPQHRHFLPEADGSKRVHLDEVACAWLAKMYARAMSPQGLTPALTTSPWTGAEAFSNYSARKAAGIQPAVEAVNSYAFTNKSGITNLSVDSKNNRIGIRTAAPTSVLDINVSSAEYNSVLTSLSYDAIIAKNAAVAQWWVGAISSGLSCAAFTGVGMRGTLASPTTLNENDIPFTISTRGYDGTSIVAASAQIRAIIDGAVSTGIMPTGYTFRTGTNGTTIADRVKIGSDGDVTFYRRPKFANASSFGTLPDGTKIVFYPMSSAAKGKTITWDRRTW